MPREDNGPQPPTPTPSATPADVFRHLHRASAHRPAPRHRHAPLRNEATCAGKAGEVLRMKESNDQGLANQIGPESCLSRRKAVDRSVDRGTCGLGYSVPKARSGCRRTCGCVEGNIDRLAKARAGRTRRGGQTPCTHGHTSRLRICHRRQGGHRPAYRKPGDPRVGPSLNSGPHRESLTGVMR